MRCGREEKMAIQCPPIEWPSLLDACGPDQDPEIVLKGTARIGATPLQVVAIRVDPQLRRTPDYKVGVPEAAYRTSALEAMLEELEYVIQELDEVTSAAERSIVYLPAGAYVIWVMPAR
jgi:hypothetical protein